MSEDLYLELIQSIKNVFSSDYSTKELSDFCETSYTAMHELRHHKRDFMSAGLKICLALYRFAVLHHLNEEYLKKEKKKGSYHVVNLSVPMNRIIVAQNPLDLFAYGFLKITWPEEEYLQNNFQLKRLQISDRVFTTHSNILYDCSDFDLSFKCGYNGTGPNNFLTFLKNYSAIDEEQLKDIIFHNDVVEYNFKTDTISGFSSKILNKKIDLYFQNKKLIIVLRNYINPFLQKSSQKLTLEDAASDILFLEDILSNNYGLSVEPRCIRYIPECVHREKEIYLLDNKIRGNLQPENHIHIVLEYDEFEIWIPYSLYQFKGDIFSNEEILSFVNSMNLAIHKNEEGFLQSIIHSYKSIDDVQTLVVRKKDSLSS